MPLIVFTGLFGFALTRISNDGRDAIVRFFEAVRDAMFVLIEWVRRGKKISPRREGMVHMVGYLLILILVGVISYFDIVRLVSGDTLLQ